jgi:hypothetical protein
LQQQPVALEKKLVAIRTGADTIDHQELAGVCERNYRMMPGAATIVDPLRAIGHERAHVCAIHVLTGRRNYYKQGRGAQGHEELAGQWRPFEHCDRERQLVRDHAIKTHLRSPAVGADLDLGELAVLLRRAAVDHIESVRRFDDITERGKARARQRLGSKQLRSTSHVCAMLP